MLGDRPAHFLSVSTTPVVSAALELSEASTHCAYAS